MLNTLAVMKKVIVLFGVSLIFYAPIAYSAYSEYGRISLSKGSGYVIRVGKRVDLEVDKAFVVLDNDLIKLEDNSNGVLISKEKAEINIGSNAVLKVRSWENSKTTGFLSLLYGKIKAVVSGLMDEESFNIKTANSVIGVKGTEYSAGTNEDGNSYVWTISDYTYLTDTLRNRQMIVPHGYYATNLADEGLQKMVAVNKDNLATEDLASSKIGIKAKKASFMDDFFVKRPDIGLIPPVNRESFDGLKSGLDGDIERSKPRSIIQIQIGGSLN